MLTHQVRPNIPNEPAHTLHKSYGRAEIPSLIAALKTQDAVIRIKASNELCDAVHRPENATTFLTSFPAGESPYTLLITLLRDANSAVRKKISEAVAAMVLHRSSRPAAPLFAPLLERATVDNDSVVRSNSVLALARMAGDEDCVGEAMNLGMLSKFVTRVLSEDNTVKLTILEAMHTYSSVSLALAKEAVASGAVKPLVELCATPCADPTPIQIAAARALLPLSALVEGKQSLCAVPEAVQCLVSWIGISHNTFMCAHCAGVAAAIAVEKQGKEKLIQAGAVDVLKKCIEVATGGETVTLPAIQAMANIAEMPTARAALQVVVPTLQRISKAVSASDLEQRAAERAIQVITWKP